MTTAINTVIQLLEDDSDYFASQRKKAEGQLAQDLAEGDKTIKAIEDQVGNARNNLYKGLNDLYSKNAVNYKQSEGYLFNTLLPQMKLIQELQYAIQTLPSVNTSLMGGLLEDLINRTNYTMNNIISVSSQPLIVKQTLTTVPTTKSMPSMTLGGRVEIDNSISGGVDNAFSSNVGGCSCKNNSQPTLQNDFKTGGCGCDGGKTKTYTGGCDCGGAMNGGCDCEGGGKKKSKVRVKVHKKRSRATSRSAGGATQP